MKTQLSLQETNIDNLNKEIQELQVKIDMNELVELWAKCMTILKVKLQ